MRPSSDLLFTFQLKDTGFSLFIISKPLASPVTSLNLASEDVLYAVAEPEEVIEPTSPLGLLNSIIKELAV